MASVKDWRLLEMTAAVAPEVLIAVAPGLTGGTEGVAERVLYTAGETVKNRRPRCPYLRLDWIDVEFAFSLKWTLEMVL